MSSLILADHKDVTLVGIAGPSCAGKSTAVRSLRKICDFSYIPLDNFFRKRPIGSRSGYANWEVRESLLFDRLAECLGELKRGEPTMIPSRGWTEEFTLRIDPSDLVIVEGFILFADKGVCDLLDYKIFIDLLEEEQLLRRIWRDGEDQRAYIEQVVIPSFRTYRQCLLNRSDVILDGSIDGDSLVKKLHDIILSFQSFI